MYDLRILLIVGVLYSVAIWHVSHKYHAAAWEKEKAEAVAAELKTERANGVLIAEAVTKLDDKLTNMHSTQTTIHQKVIRETTKEPVYSQCITTDGVLHNIEDAITAGH